MIINDHYRFVFVHTPKTAGTSMRRALELLPGNNVVAPSTAHEPPRAFMARHQLSLDDQMPSSDSGADKVGNYLFFCFVRNPWCRFLSLHRYLMKYHSNKVPVPESVDDLAQMLEDGTEWVARMHSVRPQIEFAAAPVSFVGHYETMAEDLAILNKRLGMTIDIGHENESGAYREDYRTAMSARTASIIATCYKDDIARFGYTYDRVPAARTA